MLTAMRALAEIRLVLMGRVAPVSLACFGLLGC